VAVNTRYAPDVLEGWGVRGYNWQGSATIQHELRPGVGATLAYFRTSKGNFTASDNLNQAPGDFEPYCVAAPADTRLPGGGGYQVCGLYDLTRALFGVASAGNLVTQASNYGKQTEVFDGVDASIAARFGKGGIVSGGISTGRTVTDNCSVLQDSPQKQYCHQTNPWRGQTQIKINGTYPLPWDLAASAVFQNLPGVPITATRAFTNAEIAPSLGRNLAACANPTGTCTATASVLLIEPFTRFEKRLAQLDVRLTKVFRFGGTRLQGMFDVYNVLNANTVLAVNGTYGSAWLRPTGLLGGRLAKFGAQFDF
jgi:hypothetical protein